ncbi:AI-2E family transporter [Urbifossiella limnaea]|uniref:AI-2 transport protein TqsA n=1 Tax=Urbifossiella limnaea TaxID=2528023 RepID=A0A517XMM5_9BACT|nr:AI-2E family transporter [Urbifossiella limnaea]QDU18742.1 AI-2 transport protein TqsA [Urbifossiella limnaea]
MTELPPWRDPSAVRTAAAAVIAAAAGWFLLRELGPVVRPLLFAVILAYVILPYHSRLRHKMSAAASLALLGGAAVLVVAGIAVVVYASALSLAEELPALQKQAVALLHGGDDWVKDRLPWLHRAEGGKQIEEQLAAQVAGVVAPMLAAAAGIVGDAVVIGLYLLFLLGEAAQLPERVRASYPPERADSILKVAGDVNAAIVSYLKAKVISSLAIAAPVGLILAAFGVPFAPLWAVLTFLCNFIPYIGSVVAYLLPVGFAFLRLPLGWQPVAVAVLVLGCHLASAMLVEPMLLGRAVGLSPLVILGSLAFWGLLWGVPGMFLAVPLTVVAVIVMGHFDTTRPLARLLGG